MQYIFDGTWYGLFTAVFDFFDREEKNVTLINKSKYQPALYDSSFQVITDIPRALRVLKGLKKQIDKENLRALYCTFLSEMPGVYDPIFQTIIQVFSKQKNVLENYGDSQVLLISQTAKKVEREKHRMKAFIRFEKAQDGLFFCLIEPDFNVLPLIKDFFQKRYADQTWLIYDKKRNYGLHYDKHSVSEVVLLQQPNNYSTTAVSHQVVDEEEEKFQKLWQDYFKSTNIEARKNIKLHLQHVPKRYWKHLIEKRDFLTIL